MGTTRLARRDGVGLADALFTPVQQRVLGLLFAQPDRRFQSAEIIRLAESGTGAVHRQLERLAASGWLTATREGNQKYYQANRKAPGFRDLQQLILKTSGLVQPLRDALAPQATFIQAAFVYGSVAQGRDRATSDIDLLVVSDRLSHAELYKALEPAERILSRTVNALVMTADEWRCKRALKGSFAARLVKKPRVFIVGTQADVA